MQNGDERAPTGSAAGRWFGTAMSTEAQASLAAAERLFSVVERGDLEEMRNVFTPDAGIWHNDDGKTIGVEQSIASIRGIQSICDEYRYTEIKRLPTPEGFVQQHLLILCLKNGTVIHDRACCVCRVTGGRIAHMDAYHDSAVFRVPGFSRSRDAARNEESK